MLERIFRNPSARKAMPVLLLLLASAVLATYAFMLVEREVGAQSLPTITITADKKAVYELEKVWFTLHAKPAPTTDINVSYSIGSNYKAADTAEKVVTIAKGNTSKRLSVTAKDMTFTDPVKCKTSTGDVCTKNQEWKLRGSGVKGDIQIAISHGNGYRWGTPSGVTVDVYDKDISGSIPATATPTHTATPTATPTNTPVPTHTPTPNNAPVPTDTPTATPTNTPVPTHTPTPNNVPVPTDTPTATPSPTPTVSIGDDPGSFASAQNLQSDSLTNTPTPTVVATGTADQTDPTPLPEPQEPVRIDHILPRISGVTLLPNDRVMLSVDVYGRQLIKDQSLADDATFEWRADRRAIDGVGTSVVYTAPSLPGIYTVTAELPPDECLSETKCTASFAVQVRPNFRLISPPTVTPQNPPGDIPSVITDAEGRQYAVFTPEEGGEYVSDGIVIKAGPGVVPNGQIIGICLGEVVDASNVGITDQRYTLFGKVYTIIVVNASGARINDYQFKDVIEISMPLPVELRSNLTNVAAISIIPDDSLSVLSSNLIFADKSILVSGSTRLAPSKVAIGRSGAPEDTSILNPNARATPKAPDTGGTTPPPQGLLVWLILLGIFASAFGTAIFAGRRGF